MQNFSSRIHESSSLWVYESRVHQSVVLFGCASTLYFCDVGRILHAISEGMVTVLFALCTVLPVCQNYRTGKSRDRTRAPCIGCLRDASCDLFSEITKRTCALSGVFISLHFSGGGGALLTHPVICSLKYPMHLCFVWSFYFTSL